MTTSYYTLRAPKSNVPVIHQTLAVLEPRPEIANCENVKEEGAEVTGDKMFFVFKKTPNNAVGH